jgi:hypothetical protein
MNTNYSVKPKPVLLIVGIAAGTLLLITAIVLAVVFLNKDKEKGIIGPWHNEDLKQLLRFEEDNLLDIETESGMYKASYIFDEDTGEGFIVNDNKTISFYLKGNSIFLISPEGEVEYLSGDMKIYAEITATPTPTSEETSPFETMPTPTATTAPTSAPTTAPTSAPTATPSAAPTLFPTLIPGLTIDPDFLMPLDPLFPLLGTPVVGIWYSTDNPLIHFEFFDDDTYTWEIEGFYTSTDIYEYAFITGVGQVYVEGSGWTAFSVEDDILSIGTVTYERG